MNPREQVEQLVVELDEDGGRFTVTEHDVGFGPLLVAEVEVGDVSIEITSDKYGDTEDALARMALAALLAIDPRSELSLALVSSLARQHEKSRTTITGGST